MDWRYVLEMANGVWTIVSIWLFVFLAYHLKIVGVRHQGAKNGDGGVQLAIGIWIVCVGVLTTRMVVWASRFSNDGFIQLKQIETITFVTGTIIGLIGFLCILRVVTMAMLGHWPWLSALACCAVYIAWSVIRIW
jgi:hypothetical protein